MAANQRTIYGMGSCQHQRPPVFQAASQGRRTLAELRPINAAADGEIGMGVHVIKPARNINPIDDADMAIGIMDHGAGTDGTGLDRGGIEIGEDTAFLCRIGAVGRGVDSIQHVAHRPRPIDAATVVDDFGARHRHVGGPGIAGITLAADGIDIGKRQTFLPGVIGAQKIRQLGAIDIHVQELAVLIAGPGIGGRA